jgi:antitoxin component of MazEF toxin-antitoxin module|tara:strand:- start:4435 stop:4599 length:165 start_codon:yes stop_codon:yes gene_type:complete
MTVYNSSDIFTEDENGDFTMHLPDEVIKTAGFEPGDNLKISVGDKGTLVIERVE